MHSIHPLMVHKYIEDRQRHLRSTSLRVHRQSIRGQRRSSKRR